MGLLSLHQSTQRDLSHVIAADIERQGVSAVVGVVPAEQVERLGALVDEALAAEEREYPPEREPDIGRTVFLPHHHAAFLDLLDEPSLMGPCEAVLGPDCILYTMTTLCQPPHGLGRPLHVDTEYVVPDFVVGLGVMVLLDDFTPNSGPTRMHPDVTVEAPTAEAFELQALQLEAPAGSACWFHGRIWHDALPNRTNRWRRSILLAVVRPWVRQRFDMPRMVAHLGVEQMTPGIRQKLGFDLIAPGSYEEYFLPDANRKDELLRRAVDRA